MPTVKPRVNVSMEQSDYDLLTAFASRQGVSRASVLLEMWQTAAPVMARILKMFEEAERAKASVKKGILEAAIEAESKIMPLSKEVLLNLDLFEEAVKDAIIQDALIKGVAEGGDPTRGEVPSAASGGEVQPPSSNTGVRFRRGRGVAGQQKGH